MRKACLTMTAALLFLGLCQGAAAQNEADPNAPKTITWKTPGADWRKFEGERFAFRCPERGTVSQQLWGTDIYSDDSSICTAAAHAGLISVATGGVVTMEVLPGQNSYRGSKRNGIESWDYESWPGSFRLLGESEKSGATPPGGWESAEAAVITWSTRADQVKGAVGIRMVLRCPENGDARHRVWGTDVYTDDSSICVAAIHAGLISVEGGVVKIEIRPGEAKYQGSRRNNVITEDYGSWTRSFSFVAR